MDGITTGRLLSWLKWSERRTKSFVAQRYEPLLRFDTTPIHDVTLAENLYIPDSSHCYEIVLPTPSPLVVLSLTSKASASATVSSSLYAAAVFTNDSTAKCSKSEVIHKTYNMVISIIASALYGFGDLTMSSGKEDSLGTASTSIKTSINPILPLGTKIKKIQLWVASDHYLWEGTTIKAYAAKEIE